MFKAVQRVNNLSVFCSSLTDKGVEADNSQQSGILSRNNQERAHLSCLLRAPTRETKMKARTAARLPEHFLDKLLFSTGLSRWRSMIRASMGMSRVPITARGMHGMHDMTCSRCSWRQAGRKIPDRKGLQGVKRLFHQSSYRVL